MRLISYFSQAKSRLSSGVGQNSGGQVTRWINESCCWLVSSHTFGGKLSIVIAKVLTRAVCRSEYSIRDIPGLPYVTYYSWHCHKMQLLPQEIELLKIAGQMCVRLSQRWHLSLLVNLSPKTPMAWCYDIVQVILFVICLSVRLWALVEISYLWDVDINYDFDHLG